MTITTALALWTLASFTAGAMLGRILSRQQREGGHHLLDGPSREDEQQGARHGQAVGFRGVSPAIDTIHDREIADG